jgi:cytochrome c-type biogenesis protein CcmH
MPRPRCPPRRKLPALLAGGLLAAVALLPATASAQAVSDPTPLQYRDAAEEARFHALAAELRCVQCQNQSLADSNAQIAHDLRREVLDLMNQGKSDAEIKRFLVDRYGEFVLYKPEVSGSTWLLWFGPLVLLLAGAAVIFRLVRKRSGSATEIAADDGQEW